MNHQQSDGSWGDSLFTPERDTAAAVNSLRYFSEARHSIERAGQWLGGTYSTNLDYLARSVESFSALGKDSGARVSEIIVRQNQDSGWGAVVGYESNPSDTALAISALAASGYSDRAFLARSIDYLKLTQNPDGGWGENSLSNILVTANVLAAFSNFRSDFQLETSIQRALPWLAARQNPDGGFGNSPSTIYSTAVAVTALKQLGSSSPAIQ